ncbi:hypothetical protein [Thauera sp.]|jgi:hypothetical protein|uniref:hypothetical protein n=1 Tax=Thauera sp. TaxID=1905334 RepID=UPI001D94FF91|nr:hypothetical protein [Thauera sp.]MBV2204613.1 hypothetical protein [Pseudomonas sp.]HRO34848.1 hypothetical protein [Thauera sp.]
MITKHRLAGSLLVALTGAAMAAPPLEAELVGAFFETEQVDVAVSGSVVVGVTSAAVQGGKSVDNLVLLHAAGDPQVCLTMLSRDGVYYSRNTFRLPDAGTGQAVRLPYRSSLRDRLGNYEASDLAMRASAGNCEHSTNLYYVLGTAGGTAPGTIRVFVNSFGATDVFYRSEVQGLEGACTPITEGRRTSFDHWCDIPWPGRSAERVDIGIERERYGREMPPVTLTLVLLPQD